MACEAPWCIRPTSAARITATRQASKSKPIRYGRFGTPFGDWPAAITRTPAQMMGLKQTGSLSVGAPADFVIFPARRYSELLSRPHTERMVIRGGRLSEATVPDYAELD